MYNDLIPIAGVNSWGSEKCSQDQNHAWDNVTDAVTARRVRTTKPRFQEKLKTKKCRDTQYRHIIVTEPVTIVTLPVGLSATDQLPSDWSTQHFLGLWLAEGVTLLIPGNRDTRDSIPSHISLCHNSPNVMGTLSFMRSAGAWVRDISCRHQCLTEDTEETFEGSAAHDEWLRQRIIIHKLCLPRLQPTQQVIESHHCL